MKLLTKQEVVTLKGTERKKEVDEGAKLARKIDTLRKTASEEEANLSKFRSESLKKLKSDIEVLVQQKDTLVAEITTLKDERTRLQIPLDTEWDKVHEKQKEIEKIEEDLKQRDVLFSKDNESVKNTLRDLDIEKQRISDIKKQISDLSKEAVQYNTDAKALMKLTEMNCNIIVKACETRQNDVQRKENELKYKETDIENQRLQNESDKEWIRQEKIRLIDREQTLERNIKRLSKK